VSAARPLPADELDLIAGDAGVGWDALRGARLLLTGGTGFFGTWLVESFLAANRRHRLGASAVLLTRDPERIAATLPHVARSPEITLLSGDVRGFTAGGEYFTHVIHGATAASAKLNADAPLEMLSTIIDGTRRTLDVAVASGAKRVLFLSSGAVYGPQPSELVQVPESFAGAPDPLDAGAAYAHGKRLAEHLCRLYAERHGLEIPIARAFAFVGPHLPLDAHFAIGNFLRDALAGRPVAVGGDGTPHRSYLHAADLARWLWTLLIRGTSARAYNVGSERTLPIAEVARLVSRLVGTGEVRIAGIPTPGRPPSRYVPSTARARTELGLVEQLPLEDAIARTARWLSSETPVRTA
jgi:nucleoside-diphosphate-sugar epimerase